MWRNQTSLPELNQTDPVQHSHGHVIVWPLVIEGVGHRDTDLVMKDNVIIIFK